MARHDRCTLSSRCFAPRRRSCRRGALPAAAPALAQDSTTLTFWNGTYTFQDPNDKTKDKSEFYIYQAIGRFEAANPGLKVEMENLPQDPTMFVQMRTASVAKNGPDVIDVVGHVFSPAQGFHRAPPALLH